MSSSTNTPENELASIRRELNELRQLLGAMRGNGQYHGNGTSVLEAAESTALTDRRGMMKKMAGLAVGVAAVGLLKPMNAAAKANGKGIPDATGGNMIIGAANSPTNAPDVTYLINPGSVLFPKLLQVDNYATTLFPTPSNSIISLVGHVNDESATPTGQSLYGVYGQATTVSGFAFGVYGVAGTIAAPSGDGVTGIGSRGVVGVGFGPGCGVDGSVGGTSTIAYGVLGTSAAGVGGTFQGGRCAVLLVPGAGAVENPNITPPSGGGTGDVYRGSTNASLWYRTNATTNPYRRLADATTAGALTLLASPVRYIDTRPGGTGDTGGAYTNGAIRQYNFVTLQAGTIPAGARGIVGNIVAVSPTSSGNLALSSTGVFDTAVLNFNPNQDIGNHFVIALDASGNMQVKATINGAGANLQLVIDIYGYYL